MRNTILLFGATALLFIQAAADLRAQSSSPDSLGFPASWKGDWQGQLQIFSPKGIVQTVSMALEIHPIDSSTQGRYTFGMIYGSKSQDWRPYELVPVQPERGVWKVDEKNSIAMESYLFGERLLCWFVVQNNRILCTYERRGDEMIFEVVSGKETAVSTTGRTQQGEEEIPEVLTYPIGGFQRAILRRQ